MLRGKLLVGSLLFAGLALQGCSQARNSFYGPLRPVQAGQVGSASSCSENRDGLAWLERRFVEQACASQNSPTDPSLAKDMFTAGATLVAARCNDYFAQKAGSQTGVRTAGDLVMPIVGLLGGIVSLANMSEAARKDWGSALSFGSTAVLAGLKTYEANFLFSANNIENVRTLTTSALMVHSQGVQAAQGLTFDSSVQYLIEHQMMCTPGSILHRTQEAIANQSLRAFNRSTGGDLTPGSGAATPAATSSVPAGTPIGVKGE